MTDQHNAPTTDPIDHTPARLAWVAASASTLNAFYRPLIRALVDGPFDLWVIASDDDYLAQLRRDFALNTWAVPIVRTMSPGQDFLTVRRLARFLRQSRVQLIHTHTTKAGLLGMLGGWLARVPHRVHTLHGLRYETENGLRRALLRSADRTTCTLAHRVCPVSPSLRQRAIQDGVLDAAKCEMLGHGSACGLDFARFACSPQILQAGRDIRARLQIPPNAQVIGFVGRLFLDKGLAELVQAFTDVARDRPDTYLLLVGHRATQWEGDVLPSATDRLIREHPGIIEVGNVSDPVPYYAAMDLCALPSHREGLGYALIEAAAMELPTVACQVTGCVDAVLDGKTGLLVPPRDAPALANAMTRLIDDPDLRHKLGTRGAQWVRSQFDSRLVVQQHLQLYRRLLEGPAKGPWSPA